MVNLSRREREKQNRDEKRRNDIIEVAKTMFLNNSYNDVSMEKIADEIGLSKASVYNYIKNKQSLYFKVVIKGMEMLRDYFKENMEKEETGLGKVLSVIEAFFNYMNNFSDYHRLNQSVRSDERFITMLSNGEIEDTDIYTSLAQELLELIMNAVQQGIQDKSLREDLNPMMTSLFLGEVIEKTLELPPYYGIPRGDYIEHCKKVLLFGIAGEKANL